MNIAALFHLPEHPFVFAPSRTVLAVRLQTAANDIKKCVVRYKNVYNHDRHHQSAVMKRIAATGVQDCYEAELRVAERRFKYYFQITFSDDSCCIFDAEGVHPPDYTKIDYFYCSYLLDEMLPSHPRWAEGAVIYQVLVDRFCPPAVRPQHANKGWGELPDRQTFYGGDFSGLDSKLDYIRSLGTDVLYLNPVFLSDTYHKYDIKDYYRIDPSYGSAEDLRRLVDNAHALGMRVVLDAVFNHCSDKNPLFLDVLDNGAASPYADWFNINGFPVKQNPPNYDCFACVCADMPRLNTSNPEVQEYLVRSAEYWTKQLGIDGWRLDVADEVSHELWQLFRKRLRAINPDIFILGEVWHRATKWLQGNEFDSVTNYKFRDAVIDIAVIPEYTAADFWRCLDRNKLRYPGPVTPVLVNLLGSHDTRRIASATGDERLTRLCLVTLLTYSGMPLIYYGDETGMGGQEDPDNRRSMCWDLAQSQPELLNLTRILGGLRRKNEILRRGEVEAVDTTGKVLAYWRKLDGQQLLTVVNFGDCAAEITFDNPQKTDFRDIFDSNRSIAGEKPVIAMAPHSAAVLIPGNLL